MIEIKRERVITGLDIGSSKVSALSVRPGSAGAFEILAQVTGPSMGVSRGAIVNLNETVNAVSSVLGKICEKISRRPGDIYVNISGDDLKGNRSRGMIPLSVRGREVTARDMGRCVDAASTMYLPFDREIVHRIVQNFSIDDQRWIKNPLGLFASRLSCQAYIVSVDINHLQNLHKCVSNAGYDIKEIVFSGLADAAALLDATDSESGIILLDIGASLTEISMFLDGILVDFEIIASGSGDIKGDFKDSVEFNQLLTRIEGKVRDFSATTGKVNSIYLTGGISFTDGIVEFLESKLPFPIKMGVVKGLKGPDISSLDCVRLVTAIGLTKYACQKQKDRARLEKNIVRRLSNTVVDIFNNYF